MLKAVKQTQEEPAVSRVGLESRRDSQFPAWFARQGTSLWRRTMPHSQHQQPIKSGPKVQVVPGGQGAGSWDSLSIENPTRSSCGQARYAAPRTFPLARVTVGACREHTPMPPVTMRAFISIAKPFKALIHLEEICHIPHNVCELPKSYYSENV